MTIVHQHWHTRAKRGLPAMALVLLVGTAACNPVFAPPVRSSHYGSPGRLRSGQMEVAGAANVQGSGGPMIAVNVAPHFQWEIGSEHRLVDEENWSLGYAGVRYALDLRDELRHVHAGFGPVFDVETGVGAGVGGVDDRENPPPSYQPLKWDERIAYGNYFGIGAGLHANEWLSFFLRMRMQVTGAKRIPMTVWGSTALGTEFSFEPVAFYLATLMAGYDNRHDDMFGWIPVEGGVSLRWDVF